MWLHFIVPLAILALSLSLATRVVHDVDFAHISVKAHPSHAERQRLAIDAIEMARPIPALLEMVPPIAVPHAPPVEPVLYSAEVTESLYNRPPPSLSLL